MAAIEGENSMTEEMERASPRRLARRRAALIASSALALTLAACGDSGGGGATAEGGGAADAAPSATEVVQEAGAETQEAAAQAGADEAVDPALAAKGYALGDLTLGDPSAPVTIIEYASLTCPHCASFHEETVPALKAEYIDTGKAQLVVRELYGAQEGLMAAAIARCGGADQYHAFLDVLFDRQRSFTTQDPNANMAELRRIGRLGGLSSERIEACLSDQTFLESLLQTASGHLERDSVPATPYLIIESSAGRETLRGAAGPAQMREVIDRLTPQ